MQTNTGTLGPLLNKDSYNEDERTVLAYFFTNLDKNVYAPTHALPYPVWAFFVGQYSRSPLSMRDRFLQIFRDMEAKRAKGEITDDDYISLPELAKAIREGGQLNLSVLLRKAEGFLKKWGVDYGHASLKDADKVRFAIEEVSQVALNFIQLPDPNLGDYQEKSTRYVEFATANVIVPPKLLNSRFGKRVQENNRALIESYSRNLLVITDYVKKHVIRAQDFKSPAAFERTAQAKAFDVLRYWLPMGIATSMGATWPTRVAESHFSQMLSHPLEEVRLIGSALLEEGRKISPGLLTHVQPNDYFQETVTGMDALTKEMLPPPAAPYLRWNVDDVSAKLVSYSPFLEDDLLVAILYEFANAPYETIAARVSAMDDAEKDRVLEEYVGRRGPHDLMLHALCTGFFRFELTLDLGAWRDVKRQRVGTMLQQRATGGIGFAYPEFLCDAPELAAVKREYEQLMEQTTSLWREVTADFPYEAQYVPAMGHLMRCLYEFHPRQAQYVIELRTPPAGHQSYRVLFQKVFEEVARVAPRLAKFIHVNYDEPVEGRKQSEERAEAKKQRLIEEARAKNEAASQ